MVGIFTPWKLANTAKQDGVSLSHLLNITGTPLSMILSFKALFYIHIGCVCVESQEVARTLTLLILGGESNKHF